MMNLDITGEIKKIKEMIENNREELATLAIAAGTAMTLHHRITSNKWYDEDQKFCHGKAGIIMTIAGLALLNE